MADVQKLASLIEGSGDCVQFGTAENAPGEEWVQKAEQRLGVRLPKTYLWFLSNYGGGEIGGDEVYSIYGMDFETVSGGDIVFQYLAHQKSKTLASDEIPLMQNDQGEGFFFKASAPDPDGEYPVFVKRGGRREQYAENFADFLEKRINELCES